MRPTVLYAKSDDLQIAYTVVGTGPIDLVWTPGSYSHIEAMWDSPYFVRLIERAASFARVIFFDKRGTGMSDRPVGVATLEQRIDDIRAVMDAARSERAHIFGVSEGGSMACLFAATYPQRTHSLLLYGTRPRWTRATDYPWGPTEEEAEQSLQEAIADNWRMDVTTERWRRWFGAQAGDPAYIEWWQRLRSVSATPAARIALSRMNRLADVRDILPSIRVPTLVLAKTGDPLMPPDCARDLASRIPGARLVAFEGEGHVMGEQGEEIVDTIREWVTDAAGPVATDRFLATLLFVDLVGSTDRIALVGDAAWRDLLGRYYTVARRELAVYGGVEVDTAGDGLLAHFDGPGRGIRCARAIERGAVGLGLQARAGLHTGEVERDRAAVRGIAVHLASRVASLAAGNEVLVSSTVRDLVAGSGLTFSDRGIHTLKGIPGDRQVLALEGA